MQSPSASQVRIVLGDVSSNDQRCCRAVLVLVPCAVGRPSADDITAIQSPFAATMLQSLPVDNPRTFQHMFPNASPEATDLVRFQHTFGEVRSCFCSAFQRMSSNASPEATALMRRR